MICDIEGVWNTKHEDLPAGIKLIGGTTRTVLQAVQSLPGVENAHLAPEISLPMEKFSGRKTKR